MAPATRTLYFFRHKLDGTDDAICLICFRTVPCVDVDLDATQHQCDAGALMQRSAFARD